MKVTDCREHEWGPWFVHSARIVDFGPGGFHFSTPDEMTTIADQVCRCCRRCFASDLRHVWPWNRKRWMRRITTQTQTPRVSA